VDRYREDAEAHSAAGRSREALEALDAALRIDPWSEELFHARVAACGSAVQEASDRAGQCEAARDWEGATRAWSEVLALEPASLSAREALGAVRRHQAADLLAEGDRLQDAGNVLAAVEVWQRARELDPSDEVTGRLHRAEVGRCLAAGTAFYETGRMAEAAFQFKKALALDPGNETAERYLGYSRGMAGADSLISDRFSRLE
jgi:tetratricopeptide (TPR) repeat protein